MGHVDGLLLFLDLLGAVDANRDGGHHVAPPCAVFSPIRCCREATPSVPRARIFESRLDPVKQFHFRWRWTEASFYRASPPAQRSHASTSGRGEIILLPNHLSGDPTPGRQGLRLTRHLRECSRLLDLRIPTTWASV